MVTSRSKAAAVLAVGATVGEGPAWDERTEELSFVDIIGQHVHRFRSATGEHWWFPTEGPAGAVALTENRGHLLALHDCFVYTDRLGNRPDVSAGFRADGAVSRFNDAKIDRWGRLLAGSVNRSEPKADGTLYALSSGHHVAPLLENVYVSNGTAWSPDASTFCYIDTPTCRGDAFDVDPGTGALGARRPVVAVQNGSPVGMAVDDDGWLWVAIRDGELFGVLEVPEGGHVCSLALGGAEMSTLFIATARYGPSEDELARAPYSGQPCSYEAPVAGPPSYRFAGRARA